ncbi:Protein kinase-like (PK-like) [Fusarium austroafricanum]|uniref:Protein kinase-like (PK-like) n=1 Tax=Fusarium austroafricanum TaxID=2364996 RepID=A0A8H4KNM9_9HYPO|nr:Protein kinase-like (PK-like) [Fusarium austroafricanum]
MNDPGTPANKIPPTVTSLQDLAIIEAWDTEANKPKYVTFYLVTPDEEVFFGQSTKNKRELSFAEFTAALELVKDEEIYPEIPNHVSLKIAPDDLDNNSVYVKRPGLNNYETMKGTDFIPKELLAETLTMEQISQTQHPNIIKYHGCRTRRGRITSIVLERLNETLQQYSTTPEFEKLDKLKFLDALQSAVDYIHSLGLAHNDVNPYNIMVKDGMPVLIDFGSCRAVGSRLSSLGTEGWYEEIFFTSEKKHDTYSLNKLREWIQNPQ